MDINTSQFSTIQADNDTFDTTSLYKGNDPESGIFQSYLTEISVEPLEIPHGVQVTGYNLTEKEPIPELVTIRYDEDYYKNIEEIRQRSIDELRSSGTIIKALLAQEENL